VVRTFTGKISEGIDEGRGIWTELCEEVAETIDDQKWVYHLLDVGNEGEQAKGDCHHAEAENLDSLAAKLIHRQAQRPHSRAPRR
jgi:hypothetical protein